MISDALAGALIGAAITGMFSLGLQKRKEWVQTRRLKEGLVAEIQSMRGFDLLDDEDEVPHPDSLPTQIYESNAGELGRIQNQEAVVQFYSDLIAQKAFTHRQLQRNDPDFERVRDNLDTLSEKRQGIIDDLSD